MGIVIFEPVSAVTSLALSSPKCKILEYCKDFAILLFCVIWACLAMSSKNDTISLQKTLMFIYMLKIMFILQLFLEILQILQT